MPAHLVSTHANLLKHDDTLEVARHADAILEKRDVEGHAYVGRREALRSRRIITNPAPTMNTTPGKIRCTGHSLNTIQPIASADSTPKYSNGARSDAGVRL